MKKALLFGLLTIASLNAFSQSPNIKNINIAPWKNNAKGAYSIFHDDLCMETSSGIEAYADTVAYNREIPIAFAIVTGECSSKEWEQARRLISHGHEISNHSHDHFCGLPVDWCPREYYTREDYGVQFDLSQRLIEEHTGVKANLYVFPYDLFDDTMITYLKDSLKIMGSRSGIQNVLNHPDSIRPFNIRFSILRPEHDFDSLNSLAQQAIDQGMWAVRGAHGVEDTSWGSIPLKTYQNHMDFLHKKSESNDLWVAAPSDVLKYSLTRYNTSFEWTKSANKVQVQLFNEEIIPNVELTFIVNLNKVRNTPYKISQGHKQLDYMVDGNQLIFNAQSNGVTVTIE